MDPNNILFVSFDQAFLNLSWNWLNDPEIKRLTNTPDFTKESQVTWFNSLAERRDYQVWGISYGHDQIGVVGLKNIDQVKGEYFGYIGNKDFWNKGISRLMIEHVIAYASGIKLKNIWLKVIIDNQRAIKAYQRHGFVVGSQIGNELLMNLDL